MVANMETVPFCVEEGKWICVGIKYLLVVAHPDDEVLGAGASMWKWSHEGDEVEVAIMCTEAKARAFRPSDAELEGDTYAATNYVGVGKKYEATFPNIEMNTVPHLKLVQFIESAIRESEPDIVIPIMTICRLPWLARRQYGCFSASRR